MNVNNNIEIGKLNLSEIKNITCFIQVISQQEGDYVLQHDMVEVKAKSIMGIYSLDLEKDIYLIAKDAKKTEVEKLIEALKEAKLLID